MSHEMTIPILPCKAISEMLEFYQALGFEITYQQAKPNTYACVRRGGIQLHFFSMRDYEPANSYSTCLVVVPDVDTLFQEFSAGLRQHFGKRPVAGIPRITPLRDKTDGRRGFNVIDPGGNWIRIVQPDAVTNADGDTGGDRAATKAAQALRAAETLAESKGDFAAAAKVLDNLLGQRSTLSTRYRVEALVMRAGVALAQGERAQAATWLDMLWQMSLTQDERAALSDELARAAELAEMLEPNEG